MSVELVGTSVALIGLLSLWRMVATSRVTDGRFEWSGRDSLIAAGGVAAVAVWSVVQYLPTTRLDYRITTTAWNAAGDHDVARTCCSALAGRDFVSVTATVAVAAMVVLAASTMRAQVQIACHLGLCLALAADEIAEVVHRYVLPPTTATTGMSDQSIHDYGVSVGVAFTGAFWIGVVALAVLAVTTCFRIALPSRRQSPTPAAL
jgi:hypothetical protein